jgi:hypothetical protein
MPCLDPALGDEDRRENMDLMDHELAHIRIIVTKKRRTRVLVNKGVADQMTLAASRGAGGHEMANLTTEESLEKENLGYRCGGACDSVEYR